MIRRDLTRIGLRLEDLEELDAARLLQECSAEPKEKTANSDNCATTTTGASTSSASTAAASTIGPRLSADLGINPRTIAETQAQTLRNPTVSAASSTSDASSSATAITQEDLQERLRRVLEPSNSTDDTVGSDATTEGSHTAVRPDDRTREGLLDDDDESELEGAVGGIEDIGNNSGAVRGIPYVPLEMDQFDEANSADEVSDSNLDQSGSDSEPDIDETCEDVSETADYFTTESEFDCNTYQIDTQDDTDDDTLDTGDFADDEASTVGAIASMNLGFGIYIKPHKPNPDQK